jgi:hypothetical protein
MGDPGGFQSGYGGGTGAQGGGAGGTGANCAACSTSGVPGDAGGTGGKGGDAGEGGYGGGVIVIKADSVDIQTSDTIFYANGAAGYNGYPGGNGGKGGAGGKGGPGCCLSGSPVSEGGPGGNGLWGTPGNGGDAGDGGKPGYIWIGAMYYNTSAGSQSANYNVKGGPGGKGGKGGYKDTQATPLQADVKNPCDSSWCVMERKPCTNVVCNPDRVMCRIINSTPSVSGNLVQFFNSGLVAQYDKTTGIIQSEEIIGLNTITWMARLNNLSACNAIFDAMATTTAIHGQTIQTTNTNAYGSSCAHPNTYPMNMGFQTSLAAGNEELIKYTHPSATGNAYIIENYRDRKKCTVDACLAPLRLPCPCTAVLNNLSQGSTGRDGVAASDGTFFSSATDTTANVYIDAPAALSWLTGGNENQNQSNAAGNDAGKIKVYPIPASSEIWVEFESKTNTKITFTLFDSNGRQIMKHSNNTIKGTNKLKLDVSNIAKGTYTLQSDYNGKINKFTVPLQ